MRSASGGGARPSGAWQIAHYILDQISLADPAAWFALEDLLKRGYRDDGGRIFRPQVVGIDYGGHYGQQVSDFSERNAARRWWATQGRGRGAEVRRSVGPKDPTKTKYGGYVYQVCTWRAKDILYQRLTFEPPAPGSITFHLESLEGCVPVDDV